MDDVGDKAGEVDLIIFQSTETQGCNSDNANEASLLEDVKDNGENSKQKNNPRKKAEKKKNTKGVETRSSKKTNKPRGNLLLQP